ncbi:MAG: winged helix-turn-helix transcriptional regulator [Rhodococcus sp.]|nr:winged helix-turn-helix transcriptional regulator [Rhodococcus sp. (in: high G+C Gram-positive bacteria)]
MADPDSRDGGHTIVHQLRALTVQLDLLGSRFAQRHDLHATDLRALIGLLDNERAGTPSTPGWLAGHLHLNAASVTALLDRMTEAGYVQRDRDTRDRRRVILTVTPEAKELGLEFFGPLISQAVSAIDTFSPDQIETISEFLVTMTDAVDTAHTEQAEAGS